MPTYQDALSAEPAEFVGYAAEMSAAATDLALAVITAAGFSIATLVIMLFSTREPFVASFAWLLAISFVATSMLLMEVAACGRVEDV